MYSLDDLFGNAFTHSLDGLFSNAFKHSLDGLFGNAFTHSLDGLLGIYLYTGGFASSKCSVTINRGFYGVLPRKHSGRTRAQTSSSWFLTVIARVRLTIRSHGICGVKCGFRHLIHNCFMWRDFSTPNTSSNMKTLPETRHITKKWLTFILNPIYEYMLTLKNLGDQKF
jgi:hypothetical protein